MSTQSEREAAARAWWKTCSWVVCREAGDTVVTASGYERPDLVLAALEAFKRIDVRDMPRVRGAIANCEWVQEAKALCDLGVTPAVLS